jgi:hypothetical protein
MLQTCRVGLRDPNPNMAKAPRLARRMGATEKIEYCGLADLIEREDWKFR